MKEEFVSYSQAVALKECGFDWKCDHYYYGEHKYEGCNGPENYNNSYVFLNFNSAPTLALAQKWLREVKGVHVLPTLESVNRPYYVCRITQLRRSAVRITDNARYFSTYESALSAGLDVAIELIKQK